MKSYQFVQIMIVPIGLRRTFNGSTDHRLIFQERAYGLNCFDTFISHFSTEFLVFACICCCVHSQGLVVKSY